MTSLNTSGSSLQPDGANNNRLLKIKKLKSKLINEEHRLVLMKKIRQSQTRPANQQQQSPQQQQQAKLPHQQVNKRHNISATSINNTPAHAHQRTRTLWSQPPQMRQPTPAGIAPPHVGNLSRNPITTPPNVVQAMMNNLNVNQQSLLISKINALNSGLLGTSSGVGDRRPGVSNIARQPITTPPNVIQDIRGVPNLPSSRRAHSGNISSRQHPLTAPRDALSGQQQSLLINSNSLLTAPSSGGRGRSSHQSTMSLTPQQSNQQSPFNKSQAAQLLVQRRSSAKQAIQKQLEQTLMQLPPKHIQLGIDFVPNANNVEFVCYIGLEACVDYLTNTKSLPDIQPLEKPFECSTCGTDFTPSWSWKRSNPVCENCVSNHVKKSIKNSQANRIKSVLTKAAKQEQEIDQKIMAEAASVVTSPSTPTTSNVGSNSQKHSSLMQPLANSNPRSSSAQQQTNNWPRASQSPMTGTSNAASRSNVLPGLNLNNPLAALGNLPPNALASLLQMNPQFSTLASLMANNASAPIHPPPPPQPVSNPNNTNQIAQVAALLMNQLTANLWNKR